MSMAIKEPIRPKTKRDGEHLFDVTCVIGSVHADSNGNVPPGVAAMRLIAEHDAPGVFTFPRENGQTQQVTVEYL